VKAPRERLPREKVMKFAATECGGNAEWEREKSGGYADQNIRPVVAQSRRGPDGTELFGDDEWNHRQNQPVKKSRKHSLDRGCQYVEKAHIDNP